MNSREQLHAFWSLKSNTSYLTSYILSLFSSRLSRGSNYVQEGINSTKLVFMEILVKMDGRVWVWFFAVHVHHPWTIYNGSLIIMEEEMDYNLIIPTTWAVHHPWTVMDCQTRKWKVTSEKAYIFHPSVFFFFWIKCFEYVSYMFFPLLEKDRWWTTHSWIPFNILIVSFSALIPFKLIALNKSMLNLYLVLLRYFKWNEVRNLVENYWNDNFLG